MQTKVLQVSKSVMYGVAGVLIVGLGVASYPFLLWQMGDVELRFQKKCLDKRVQYTNEFQELERQQYEQFQEHNRKACGGFAGASCACVVPPGCRRSAWAPRETVAC